MFCLFGVRHIFRHSVSEVSNSGVPSSDIHVLMTEAPDTPLAYRQKVVSRLYKQNHTHYMQTYMQTKSYTCNY